MGEGQSRRDFLRLAGGAAVVAATGTACRSAPDARKTTARRTPSGRTLRIAQFSHFVPAYDRWFDEDFARPWGERHGVEVVVDHIPIGDLPARAAAEVSAGRGHDLFHLPYSGASFEDDVIDHQDIVDDVVERVGPMAAGMERGTFNPKTRKRYSFPDFYVPFTVLYRSDVWAAAGARPDTWDDILRAAPKLKTAGHPLGISLSPDIDGNIGLLSVMAAYGASIQDDTGGVALDSPATVEAVKLVSALYRTGMTDEVLGWDNTGAANNRCLSGGRCSMIFNPVSAQRTIEAEDPGLARQIALAPPPAGPAGRRACSAALVYLIWKFAANSDAARQFVVDLVAAAGEGFRQSGFYNLPAFPGAVPDLAEVVGGDPRAEPPDKYGLLAGAPEWFVNLGQPGYENPAIEEVVDGYLIPKMFASAASGSMTPQEAVRGAAAQVTPIFDKWRERGKI